MTKSPAFIRGIHFMTEVLSKREAELVSQLVLERHRQDLANPDLPDTDRAALVRQYERILLKLDHPASIPMPAGSDFERNAPHADGPITSDGNALWSRDFGRIAKGDWSNVNMPGHVGVASLRRLAACWNALQGIATEVIEAVQPGTFQRVEFEVDGEPRQCLTGELPPVNKEGNAP